MNLLSFKKTTFVAGFLLLILTAQQAFAAERDLFCSNKDTTDYPWSSTTKEISPRFAHLAYKAGDLLRIKGSLWVRFWMPTLTVPQPDDAVMDKESAKAFCRELQTFCKPGRKMIGASRSGGSWNRIVVDFKHNPRDANENPSALICPNWDNHNGLIYPPVDQGQPPPYSAEIPIPQ